MASRDAMSRLLSPPSAYLRPRSWKATLRARRTSIGISRALFGRRYWCP